jgi:shikimate dehydrogenase
MIGASRVGRAVASGHVAPDAKDIRIIDRDRASAEALAAALAAARPGQSVTAGSEAEALAQGAQDLTNCTPVGMAGQGGTPLTRAAMTGAEWCFDAVCTPVETQLSHDADDAGLWVISGCKLLFSQGVDAFRIFTGLPLDEAAPSPAPRASST